MFNALSAYIYFSLFFAVSFHPLSSVSSIYAAPVPDISPARISYPRSPKDLPKKENLQRPKYHDDPWYPADRRSSVRATYDRKGYKECYRTWMLESFYPARFSQENRTNYFHGGDFTQYLGEDLARGRDGDKSVGRCNAGVYTYQGSKDLVIKVLPQIQGNDHPQKKAEPDAEAYGEAMALALAGLYNNSGRVFITRTIRKVDSTGIRNVQKIFEHPAIVMSRVRGTLIEKSIEWQNAHDWEKNNMMDDVKRLVQPKIIDFWQRTGTLLIDLNKSNILLTFKSRTNPVISNAFLFDFGWPGVVYVRSGTTEAEIKAWFDDCWDNVFWRPYKNHNKAYHNTQH